MRKGTDARPLAGVTVVDITTALAGPYCTLLLAGLGARVIKVENPRGGETARQNAPYIGRDGLSLTRQHDDDQSLALLDRNRDKYGVTLDLKHPEGRRVLDDLFGVAQVLVTNFSLDALERLGLDYDAVHAAHPGLVYCSISGFGAEGDGASRGKAMDTMIQALSGLMMTSGVEGDGPTRVGVPVADMVAPLHAVIGILATLRRAEQTGVGDYVDISMLGSVTSIVASEHWAASEALGRPTRTGNFLPRLTPFGIFECADGAYVAVCAPTDALAHRLFAAMGLDVAADPRLGTRDDRVAAADEVNSLIEGWMASHARPDVVTRLEAHGVPVAEVREPAEAVRDPLALHRGEVLPLDHPTYGPVAEVHGTGLPIRTREHPVGFTRPAPQLGEHNDHIYREVLGYAADEVERLGGDGVI